MLACSVSFAATDPVATRVLVDKSDHLLHVYAGNETLATYRIGLGTSPVGPKQREGDKRTPEGRYVLDFKKADSAYFKAIHVSYPNAADAAKARAAGVAPGGAIMIHGQPNNAVVAQAVRLYPSPDWTDGCIALSNADMQALWDLVRVPLPIEIVP